MRKEIQISMKETHIYEKRPRAGKRLIKKRPIYMERDLICGKRPTS